ncbi:hypothetical protein chiPu_0013786 [Chiloscyllium punctatum]|uniref:Uncharacterized protein n=1 Tax=Chiloscyllium punctatum TaxID=137246 RepID=A0A401SY44_CHIPU|nr:hypothetical protein [Chiloscyllium punctatum]
MQRLAECTPLCSSAHLAKQTALLFVGPDCELAVPPLQSFLKDCIGATGLARKALGYLGDLAAVGATGTRCSGSDQGV